MKFPIPIFAFGLYGILFLFGAEIKLYDFFSCIAVILLIQVGGWYYKRKLRRRLRCHYRDILKVRQRLQKEVDERHEEWHSL